MFVTRVMHVAYFTSFLKSWIFSAKNIGFSSLSAKLFQDILLDYRTRQWASFLVDFLYQTLLFRFSGFRVPDTNVMWHTHTHTDRQTDIFQWEQFWDAGTKHQTTLIYYRIFCWVELGKTPEKPRFSWLLLRTLHTLRTWSLLVRQQEQYQWFSDSVTSLFHVSDLQLVFGNSSKVTPQCTTLLLHNYRHVIMVMAMALRHGPRKPRIRN